MPAIDAARRRRRLKREARRSRPWILSGAFVSAALLAAMIIIGACKPEKPPTAEERAEAERQQQAHVRTWADEKARGLTYFRDPRSGLCFAYLFERYGTFESTFGGPALAEVDCAKVEKLLVNAPPAVMPSVTPETP